VFLPLWDLVDASCVYDCGKYCVALCHVNYVSYTNLTNLLFWKQKTHPRRKVYIYSYSMLRWSITHEVGTRDSFQCGVLHPNTAHVSHTFRGYQRITAHPSSYHPWHGLPVILTAPHPHTGHQSLVSTHPERVLIPAIPRPIPVRPTKLAHACDRDEQRMLRVEQPQRLFHIL